MYTPVLFDLHTHSISSGHGSNDTILSMAKAAKNAGLSCLGISDHGPATPGSASLSYFRSLGGAASSYHGISMFYGVELNILDAHGKVDLPASILQKLDYAFIGFHRPCCLPMSEPLHTQAYLAAMQHPKVRFFSHMDDGRYPADYEKVLTEAKKRNIYPEMNNRSLAPDSYRFDGLKNSLEILELCKKLKLPVLLSSDSHGTKEIGKMDFIFPVLAQADFPNSLILNLQDNLPQILKS